MRDKHWSFHVNAYDVEPAIRDVITETYADLHERRIAVLAYWLAGQMSCGAIDFAHDPDAGDDPSLEASEVTEAMGRLFSGGRGWETIRCLSSTYDGEYDTHRLFVDADPDGFGSPIDVKVLADKIADALVTEVGDGRIPVSADEPYDSCRGCGGYHNVNYDCASDD